MTFTTAFKTSHGRNELSTSFTTPRSLSLVALFLSTI
ncbi:hypothetical protein CsSME_00028229 [Camellia sinensis var. sinensis]